MITDEMVTLVAETIRTARPDAKDADLARLILEAVAPMIAAASVNEGIMADLVGRGLALTKIDENGTMHRIDPSDFYAPNEDKSPHRR